MQHTVCPLDQKVNEINKIKSEKAGYQRILDQIAHIKKHDVRPVFSIDLATPDGSPTSLDNIPKSMLAGNGDLVLEAIRSECTNRISDLNDGIWQLAKEITEDAMPGSKQK